MAKPLCRRIALVVVIFLANASVSQNAFEKGVCDVCSCSEAQVTCRDLVYPDVLQTYSGDSILRLTITESHLGLLRKELFTKFQNVPTIFITSNKLILDSSSISLLTEAMTLNMANNSIEILPQDMFHETVKLRHLNLTANEIPYVANGTFKNLHQLTRLLLADNAIGHLEVGALAGLSALEELDLRGNRLRRLEAGALAPLRRLRALRLDGNRLASFGPELVAALARPGLAASLRGNPLRCVCGPLRAAWEAAAARGLRLEAECAQGQPWGAAMARLRCSGGATGAGVRTVGQVLRHAREHGEDEQLGPAEVVALAEGVVLAEALQPPAAAVWRATLEAEATLQQREVAPAPAAGTTAWPVFLLCVVLTATAGAVALALYRKAKRSAREEQPDATYGALRRARAGPARAGRSDAVVYTFPVD